MRIVSWNVQKAIADDEVWNFLLQLDPDIILLQEAIDFSDTFTSRGAPSTWKGGQIS